MRCWLFHGCPGDIVPKILQQGFNRSFCGKNATFYGKGVYFARDARGTADLPALLPPGPAGRAVDLPRARGRRPVLQGRQGRAHARHPRQRQEPALSTPRSTPTPARSRHLRHVPRRPGRYFAHLIQCPRRRTCRRPSPSAGEAPHPHVPPTTSSRPPPPSRPDFTFGPPPVPPFRAPPPARPWHTHYVGLGPLKFGPRHGAVAVRHGRGIARVQCAIPCCCGVYETDLYGSCVAGGFAGPPARLALVHRAAPMPRATVTPCGPEATSSDCTRAIAREPRCAPRDNLRTTIKRL